MLRAKDFTTWTTTLEQSDARLQTARQVMQSIQTDVFLFLAVRTQAQRALCVTSPVRIKYPLLNNLRGCDHRPINSVARLATPTACSGTSAGRHLSRDDSILATRRMQVNGK